MACDKVRKDAVALGNGLTFKQAYDLAKVEKSSKTQMKIISKGDKKSDLHTVQGESAYSTQKPPPRQSSKHQTPYGAKIKKIQPEENLVDFSSSQKDASGAETPTTDQQVAAPKKFQMQAQWQDWPLPKSVMQQRLQKVHQIVSSPEYQGQDIYLVHVDEYSLSFDDDYDVYTYEEESEEETSDTKPMEPSPQQKASKPKKYH